MDEKQLLNITFSSSFDFMDTAHDLVEQVLQLAKFSEDDIYWLTIAAREAIANAIKHGNKQNPAKMVHVDISLAGEKFIMKVRDEGEGFDPASIPDPRNKENLLKDKGRGIYYMHTFMDEVKYDFKPGYGTTLTMVKNRHSGVNV